MKSTSFQSFVRTALFLGLWATSLQSMGQGAGGNNDAMLLLLEQNRNLQAEVQALRALAEEQGYEIRKLQRESLDRYTDTDNRLRSLEQMLAAGGVPASGTAVVPPGVESTSVSGPSDPVNGNGSSGAVNSRAGNSGTGNSSAPAAGGFNRAAAPGGVAANNRNLPGNTTTSSGTAPDTVTSRRPIATAAGSNDPSPTAVRQPGGQFSTRAPVRPGLEPTVLTEQQLYQMAYDSAINSQFERAIAEFDQYLGIHPQGRFTSNAHYWKGQSYLYLNRYEEAIAEYDIILQRFPDDAKVPDAMYGQAVAYEGIGETQRAAQLLRQIMRSYPNTGVANLADTRLRSLN